MKSLKIALSLSLLAAPAAFGAGNYTAENTDVMSIRGQGQIELIEGTLIHLHHENGEWSGLFSRNGSDKIQVSAEDGTYTIETWSVADNPMSPQRVHETHEIEIGDGGTTEPPVGYGAEDLLALLAAWGPCGGACEFDLNGDSTVGVPDLLEMLANWKG